MWQSISLVFESAVPIFEFFETHLHPQKSTDGQYRKLWVSSFQYVEYRVSCIIEIISVVILLKVEYESIKDKHFASIQSFSEQNYLI